MNEVAHKFDHINMNHSEQSEHKENSKRKKARIGETEKQILKKNFKHKTILPFFLTNENNTQK